MKIKYLFFPALLVFLFTLTIWGQASNPVKKKVTRKPNDISRSLGKPAFESTIDSLNTKVWIISQRKYKNMLKTKMGKTMAKMKDSDMVMDKEAKHSMTAGTHYFIFDVTNITTGKNFADSSAKVQVVSPTKITSSVVLQPMMNHFGGGVLLNEKGKYLFTINLNIGTGYKTTQFKYRLK